MSRHGVEIVKVDELKYLGSTIQSNVNRRAEEESADRVVWVEISFRGNL